MGLPPIMLGVLHFPRKRLPHLRWKGGQRGLEGLRRRGGQSRGRAGLGAGLGGHVTEPAAAPAADAVLSPGRFSISLQAAGSIDSSCSALHKHGLSYYSWKSPLFQGIR